MISKNWSKTLPLFGIITAQEIQHLIGVSVDYSFDFKSLFLSTGLLGQTDDTLFQFEVIARLKIEN